MQEMGYTHIELLPVMEHPFSGSWGYQVTGFFAPTSRLGRHTTSRLRRHLSPGRIGVHSRLGPGHFPRDAHALARVRRHALFEHADPRQGEHRDWGTLIFNYGRNEAGIPDGERALLAARVPRGRPARGRGGLDALSRLLRKQGEWIPNRYGGRENLEAIESIRQLNTLTHGESPGSMTIAEESTAWPSVSRPAYLGGLGFTYKWNMGWTNDILLYMTKDAGVAGYNHQHLTFSLFYAFTENFILPFSHNKVVHGKGSMFGKISGDDWQKAATLRALFGYLSPPREEADVHGGGVRAGPRVGPRPQSRLAPARRAAARGHPAASFRI